MLSALRRLLELLPAPHSQTKACRRVSKLEQTRCALSPGLKASKSQVRLQAPVRLLSPCLGATGLCPHARCSRKTGSSRAGRLVGTHALIMS